MYKTFFTIGERKREGNKGRKLIMKKVIFLIVREENVLDAQ